MSGVAALHLKKEKGPGRSTFISQSKFLGGILVEHGIIDPLQLKRRSISRKGRGSGSAMYW